MTSNEKVCERVGIEIVRCPKGADGDFVRDQDGREFYLNQLGKDTPAGHWLMHLMMQKLVEEGWEIELSINSKGIMAAVVRVNDNNELSIINNDAWLPSEPAAVYALFCKVHGIKEE